MAELEINLEYSGPDVEGGAMALENLVPALQGFAGAYGKVAGYQGLSVQHKLRLIGIRPGSVRLILDVWEMLGKNSAQLQSVTALSTLAMAVVSVIIQVIQAKKHTKNEPFSTNLDGNTGTVNIFNTQNAAISMSPADFNIFREKLIDSDLSRIVKPLEQGRIDSSTVSVSSADGQRISETITAAEKSLFDVGDNAVTTTRETWLTGQINSMTKSTNTGYLYLADGSRVHFRIKSDNPSELYDLFAHRGLVRLRGVAHMDENLRPTELDVFEMIPLQPTLPFGDQLIKSSSATFQA
jgi:hypothetical protein